MVDITIVITVQRRKIDIWRCWVGEPFLPHSTDLYSIAPFQSLSWEKFIYILQDLSIFYLKFISKFSVDCNKLQQNWKEISICKSFKPQLVSFFKIVLVSLLTEC